MSRRPKRMNVLPPCGWIFYTDTGFKIEAKQYPALLDLVRKHFQVNQKPIPPDLEDIILSQICENCPSDFCTGEGPSKMMAQVPEILQNTRKLVRAAKRDGDIEYDPEVIFQRMLVCTGCRMNAFYFGCWTCQLPHKIAAGAFVQTAQVASHALKACNFFACATLAIVHVNDRSLPELLSSAVKLERAPDQCWCRQLVEPDT